MRIFNRSLLLSLVSMTILLIGCPSRVPDPILPDDTDQCHAACDNLLTLECKDSKGNLLGGMTPDGELCVLFCAEFQSKGIPLNPTCLGKITDCSQINSCKTSW